jgi:hypothetical protein
MFPADTSRKKIFDNLKNGLPVPSGIIGLKRNHIEQTRLCMWNDADKKWKRD